ncbi:hypothetical protein ACLIIZ_09785 [Azonexus caeni]|jgi:hypothetical protein|uniref:hypothetical protein n=1 Tax=Azonexus caeni TaxID=266126 RepID=UPI003A864606
MSQRNALVPGGGNEFVRGFVTGGMLGAVQQRGGGLNLDRRTLRLALQGGCALAGGAAAARDLRNGQTALGLGRIALATAAVVAIENLLQDQPSKEIGNGQEEG